MNKNRNIPWWAIVAGMGCIGALCVGALGVGGFAYVTLQQPSTQLPPEAASPIPVPVTEEPAATDAPVRPELPSSELSLTGSQKLDQYYLYDDFSSDALSWPLFDDGETILKYEDGQYSIQIAKPDHYDWAYVPVDFMPTEIKFDVKSGTGSQNGTFGVFCQYQDENNYFYVEFSLEGRSYMVGQYIDGEDIVLTPENARGEYWQEVAALDSSPEAMNRIGISCNRNFITLYINDEWIVDVNPPLPVDELGEMAFFVYANASAGSEGYKVYFDNVEVFKPVQ